MNSKKTYIFLLILIIIMIATASGLVYKGSSLLKTNGDELLRLKLEHAVLDDKQKALARAKKDITTYTELEKIAKSIVPQEKDQAITVREISDIAKESGVPITAIEFPKPATNQSKSSTQGAISTDKYQLTAVKGIPGLYEMEITVVSELREPPATYEQILNMIRGLEHNRRTANITSVRITPNKSNRKFANSALTLKVYIKP